MGAPFVESPLRFPLAPPWEPSSPRVSIPGDSGAAVAWCPASGARAEVSSLTELITARRAGIGPENIIFLGPGKSEVELAACVEAGIRAVVVESFAELAELDAITAR